MSDLRKPDLSRGAVDAYCASFPGVHHTSVLLRALLDAKEAAEDRAEEAERLVCKTDAALTEARAANAAAWEAAVGLCAMHTDAGIYMGSDGRGNVQTRPMTGAYLRTLPCPDPSAVEALRRDRERVWDACRDTVALWFKEHGWLMDEEDVPQAIRAIPNPYQQTEKRHG